MCPVQQARWCVISRHEMAKCENMIMAFDAKGLKPDLNCVLGLSVRDCMDKIAFGDADLITLDAADVYVAGK
jgi:melanoma-associated antigen p97